MQNRAFMALVHATPTISHATPTISRATPTISRATPTLQNPTARVLSTQSRPKSKWRPLPLDTVVGVCTNIYTTFIYHIAESFQGRSKLANFEALWQSFLHKIWGHGVHLRHKQAVYESFLLENCILH